MRKIILADPWLKQLCESQGMNYDRVSRIIIDAQAGSPVLMYVIQFGDEGLLDVAPPEAVPPRVTS